MTTIAVLGAGAGGAAATVELMQNGHKIRLWNRSAATLQPFQDGAGVGYAGVLGEGRVEPELVSDNLQAVLDNATPGDEIRFQSGTYLLASGLRITTHATARHDKPGRNDTFLATVVQNKFQ